MVPGMLGLQWWMLTVGVIASVLIALWGRDAFYLSGKYVLTTFLALGLPTLVTSLVGRK